jgi:hypothetical protein
LIQDLFDPGFVHSYDGFLTRNLKGYQTAFGFRGIGFPRRLLDWKEEGVAVRFKASAISA